MKKFKTVHSCGQECFKRIDLSAHSLHFGVGSDFPLSHKGVLLSKKKVQQHIDRYFNRFIFTCPKCKVKFHFEDSKYKRAELVA